MTSPQIPERLDTNYADHTPNDTIVALNDHADKQEVHPGFKGDNVPEWVVRPPELRRLAVEIGVARDAANSKEQKAKMIAGQVALTKNAYHLNLLSLHRNDPSLLLNAGYELKKELPPRPAINLLKEVPEVFLKHGPDSGWISILVKRHKQSATIQVMLCTGDPNNESSWVDMGIHTKSKLEKTDLEPATRVYVKARYHDDGRAGEWSSATGIIVL